MINEKELESFIYLGYNGYEFRLYAARCLLQRINLKNNLSWEVCFWFLCSAMARQDKDGCIRYLKDWSI